MESNATQSFEESAIAILLKKNRDFAERGQRFLFPELPNIGEEHRELFLKALSNPSLTIRFDEETYYAPSLSAARLTPTGEWMPAKISMSRNSFPKLADLVHELGHSLDYWFNRKTVLSRLVILSNGQTLLETLQQELEKNKPVIMDEILSFLADLIASHAYDENKAVIEKSLDAYKELVRLPVRYYDQEIRNRRKAILSKLYRSGFIDAYYKASLATFKAQGGQQYTIVLDVLSASVDVLRFTNYYIAPGHERSYYKNHPEKAATEFFAEVFAATALGNEAWLEPVKRLLPKSYQAFIELHQRVKDCLLSGSTSFSCAIRQKDGTAIDCQLTKGGKTNEIRI